MYLCSILLHGWKTTNVKNVVGIITLLLSILVLPMSVAARDYPYTIQASDGELYTVTVGESTDIENFSIQKSDGEMLRGVTEEERAIATELYSASKVLWIIRTYYSSETTIFDWVENVKVIGKDAFEKLNLRQFATVVSANSFSVITALTGVGATTVVDLGADVLSEINGAIANHLERRLLLDAYFFALTTAEQVQGYEQVLRDFWLSWETRSIVISMGEINTAWESFYKSGEYGAVTNNLISTYLGVPGFLERLGKFIRGIVPVASSIGTLESVTYSNHHLQQVKDLKINTDTKIHQRVLEQIAEEKKGSRTALERAAFFAPLTVPPLARGTIPHQSLTDNGGAITVDVAQYFSSKNNLTYAAASNPSGIVTTSVSGSIITITPVSAGVTTAVVTARDTVNTDLTAVQTISVVVRQTSAVIVRPPTNTDPTFTVPDRSNPRAKGLRKGVSVIVDGLAQGNTLRVRSGPGTNNDIVELVGNGATGIIEDGPRSANGFTWWKIDWDRANIEGWSAEVVGGFQLLFRRPPDLKILDFNVSARGPVGIGEEIALEVDIRNNGPGKSVATEVYFYYHSGSKNYNFDDLSKETSLRIPGKGKLRVPSLQPRRNTTLTLKVDAPSVPGTYYFGAFLQNNIHDTDNTDHLNQQAIKNNLAREQQVKVIGRPDYIVESVSVSNRILNPGQEFKLRVTVRNQGLGKPTSSPTLTYYRSSDALISSRDRKVGDEFVSILNTNKIDNESIKLKAPTVPGVYYYGACVSKVKNESNSNNNCSAAAVITVRANSAPVAVGTISAQTLNIGDSTLQIDVSNNFRDPDNDPLTYTATSNNGHIATVTVSGSQVEITPISEGNATITVTASDGKLTGTQTVSVSVVKRNRAPVAVGTISAQTLTIGDSDAVLDVSSNFQDPDGGTLTYAARSNNTSIANTSVSGSQVTITPVSEGNTIITVTASDGALSAMQTISVTVSAAAPVSVDDWMPDANLQAAVHAELVRLGWLQEGEALTQEALQRINGLTAEGSQISDLTGLEYATRFTSLYLDDNQISDISAVSGLTSLTDLSLQGNSISDISAVSGLTSLKWISLDDNSISDISAVSGLTSLKWISLQDNSISDISVLSGLTSLTKLYLSGNSISDISAVSGLTSLTVLGLDRNSISDISAVSGLTSLEWLTLCGTSISDISAVSGLTSLTLLALCRNSISDISAVSGLTSLTQLWLNDNSISDISALSGLTSLTGLGLDDNSISDISALSGLTSLRVLRLDDNQISDISVLSGLTALIYLFLVNNSISDVTPLENLTALTELYLSGNPITDYGPLRRLQAKTTHKINIDVNIGAAPAAPVVPTKTALLPNYPNPFNPETWIPYQLAKPADVTLTIYNVQGVVVRQLALGHRAAGVYYNRSRAVHWDGKNHLGEKVAAGVYFVKFRAGDYTAIRKMLIRK